MCEKFECVVGKLKILEFIIKENDIPSAADFTIVCGDFRIIFSFSLCNKYDDD